MSPSSQNPETPVSPTSQALAVLMTIEDQIGDHDAILYTHNGSVVVLVDSITAFGLWVFELKARHENQVCAQTHLALSTAETRVSGCPVLVCRGNFAPAQAAKVGLAA